MPLVSVIVSAYNRPEMLRSSLQSLVNQTYTELEILVQDDSTNDECTRIVAALNDPRITYTHNRPSLGTLSNLRAGYRRATGKYVCTLNDDDLYTPTYLAAMVSALEAHPECCLAFSDHFIIDDLGTIDLHASDLNTARFGRDRLSAGVIQEPMKLALVDKSIPGMFAVYRCSEMDFADFPDESSSGYDFWLTYLAIRSGSSVFYSPQRLTSYRVHPGSQTMSFVDPQRRLRSLAYDLFTHTRLHQDSRLQRIWPALAERLASIRVSTGSAHLQLGQKGIARTQFREAMRLRPGLRPAIGLLMAALPGSLSKAILQAQANR